MGGGWVGRSGVGRSHSRVRAGNDVCIGDDSYCCGIPNLSLNVIGGTR